MKFWYREFRIKLWHGGSVVKSFEPKDYGVCSQYLFCSSYGNGWILTLNYWRGSWMITDSLDWFSQTSCLFIRELVPLDWFSKTSCLIIRGACSTWVNFPDKLSPYQGTCSTWAIFSDKLSPHDEMKEIFNWFLVLIRYQLEWWKKWLTTPFMVFPYMVRGNNQLFVTI